LKIEEGHQYNNLITEIEEKYKKYLEKANQEFKNKNYEKALKYYQLCINLDPDNTYHIRINNHFKYILNELLTIYIDCSYHSFYNQQYNLSKYYITKSLSLMILFNDKIKKNHKQFNELLHKRLDFINLLDDNKYNINHINEKDLYNIRIKNF
tara:strand:+ start:88 stop:546 length:459 start_codon:yes stop_codon:yes gene_type:complete